MMCKLCEIPSDADLDHTPSRKTLCQVLLVELEGQEVLERDSDRHCCVGH